MCWFPAHLGAGVLISGTPVCWFSVHLEASVLISDTPVCWFSLHLGASMSISDTPVCWFSVHLLCKEPVISMVWLSGTVRTLFSSWQHTVYHHFHVPLRPVVSRFVPLSPDLFLSVDKYSVGMYSGTEITLFRTKEIQLLIQREGFIKHQDRRWEAPIQTKQINKKYGPGMSTAVPSSFDTISPLFLSRKITCYNPSPNPCAPTSRHTPQTPPILRISVECIKTHNNNIYYIGIGWFLTHLWADFRYTCYVKSVWLT